MPVLFCPSGSEREQRLDDPAEHRIDTQEEQAENGRHDDHHHNCHPGFTAGRPSNFRCFGPDLPDKFTWAGLCHKPVFHPKIGFPPTGPPPENPAKTKTLMSGWVAFRQLCAKTQALRGVQPCKMSAQKRGRVAHLAGVEGLEPTALGFGDRCSTN